MRQQNVRNDPSRVYVQHIHETFLQLYIGSKVKQSKAKQRNNERMKNGKERRL